MIVAVADVAVGASSLTVCVAPSWSPVPGAHVPVACGPQMKNVSGPLQSVAPSTVTVALSVTSIVPSAGIIVGEVMDGVVSVADVHAPS